MKGLIFIPDISGFTNFVCMVPPEAGAAITRELLNEIIDHSPSELMLAEVEGDALLFYKFGEPYPITAILDSFEKIARAFSLKFRSLKLLYNIPVNLSIKFILHYGEIDVYTVKSFEKLYGRAIVESHRLLKNNFKGTDYLLITEDYLRACELNPYTSGTFFNRPQKVTKHLRDLRDINYYFYMPATDAANTLAVSSNAAAC
ncbi:MAG: DUF2652 domain-containing protein [Chitinophagaceae bacterium]|nr:MAG: DUF2652 domain-containing protein [Chitinophagaceae bacterium]